MSGPIEDIDKSVGLNRRNILKRMTAVGVGFSSIGVLAGPAAADGSALSRAEQNKAIAAVLSSDSYKTVRRRLREDGFTQKRSDAVAKYHERTDRKERGTTVQMPFKPKGHASGTASLTAFINETNEGAIALGGGVEDGEQRLHHYSDETIVDQYDGMVNWRYVDHADLDQYVNPPRSETASTATVRATAAHIPVPGYTYIGTYDISDICYVVGGACFGLFLASLADLIPGTEAIVGTGCSLAGGGCFIAETAARFTSCESPSIVAYRASWWNPWGPEFIGYPTC